ncbi:MscL family protein [Luteipulveratus sp. YIM 133132]|uniref:MscL family protein n=1 Tax=Luteipulveratus flavus TaxID=3031728 RepID=A0ABT6C8I6_9MICO|nr:MULTISPECIES: MscL family protein [unclassified Luteipulveratus]MDE9364236.1 MscL family protein [Luteipulveratus sp. YIM 133132]MDF8263606.1 MscL family protein [Luteipulveratus sp. YIM 133296]
MKGFKNFVMQGNLVEIAVGLIIALAFKSVIDALVKVIMQLVGKIGGSPDFSNWKPADLSIGAFLTALISFLIVAAVVYFLVVKPYEAAKKRLQRNPDPEVEPTEVELLAQIRDALVTRR